MAELESTGTIHVASPQTQTRRKRTVLPGRKKKPRTSLAVDHGIDERKSSPELGVDISSPCRPSPVDSNVNPPIERGVLPILACPSPTLDINGDEEPGCKRTATSSNTDSTTKRRKFREIRPLVKVDLRKDVEDNTSAWDMDSYGLEWPSVGEEELSRLKGNDPVLSNRELNDVIIHSCLELLLCSQPHTFIITPWQTQSILKASRDSRSPISWHYIFPGDTDGLFCLNIAGDHWVCVHLQLLSQQATIYDSLGSQDTSRWKEAQDTVQCLIGYLTEKLGTQAKWKFVAGKCPRQDNAYDCGIYALAMAFHLAYGLDFPDEIDAPLWRCFLGTFLAGQSLESVLERAMVKAERIMDWRTLLTEPPDLSDSDPNVLYTRISLIAKAEVNAYQQLQAKVEDMADKFEREFQNLLAKHDECFDADTTAEYWRTLLEVVDRDIEDFTKASEVLQRLGINAKASREREDIQMSIYQSRQVFKGQKRYIHKQSALVSRAAQQWHHAKELVTHLRQVGRGYGQLQRAVLAALKVEC